MERGPSADDVQLSVLREHAGAGDVVLLLVDAGSAALAVRWAGQLPEVEIEVVLLDAAEDREHLLAALPPNAHLRELPTFTDRVLHVARMPTPPRVVIEHDARAGRPAASSFKALFWTLPPGGVYSLLDHDAAIAFGRRGRLEMTVREMLDWLDEQPERPDDAQVHGVVVPELRAAGERLPTGTGVVTVRKRNRHAVMLRESEVEEVLEDRLGPDWGRVVERRPARRVEHGGRLTVIGDGPELDDSGVLDVPELNLRCYRGAELGRRLVVLEDGLLLPDSFRHRASRTRHPRLAIPTTQVVRPMLASKRRRVDGDHYLLDTAYPGHFGHVHTEVLAMFWGLARARQEVPGVRPVVSLYREMAALPEYQLQMFEALGVPREEIEYVHADEVLEVERLWSASPQMENPHWIDPDLALTWRRLTAGLLAAAGPGEQGLGVDRVFVARRPGKKRNCTNVDEIEHFFDRLGFTIYHPEDHPYRHQVATFAGATRIAGLAGSGMFSMIHAPDAKVLVLAGDGYSARNEFLIAAANGTQIGFVWGPSQVRPPADGRFDPPSFRADFEVPVRRHRRAIKRFLR